MSEVLAMLEELKQSLVIPAAEYVPAISDAWVKIDAIKSKLEEMK